MANVQQIISEHKKAVLNSNKPKPNAQNNNCNCRKERQCPLEGNCLTNNVIYQATVTRQDNLREETYIGLTENSFKTRFNGLMSSFKSEDKKNATTLSEYVWKLKDNNVPYSIGWKIITTPRQTKPATFALKRNSSSFIDRSKPRSTNGTNLPAHVDIERNTFYVSTDKHFCGFLKNSFIDFFS